ncbi:hypothetical protein [Moraxella catarrhalis]|uniref:hypothetical protein n=1 Tax=Moraxella catarrhalis TaxID=480 RepID=UPI00128C24A3|nr:hypothetical protein [Moraxella catarrhalis]
MKIQKNGKVLNGKEKIVLIFLAVLLVLVIFGLSLLNFLWVELPKVIRRPDGEGFIHQKIDDEEILCYLVEEIHLGYDLRINDNKIYIKALDHQELKTHLIKSHKWRCHSFKSLFQLNIFIPTPFTFFQVKLKICGYTICIVVCHC